MTPLPDKAALSAYLAENPRATRRDIARAFGIRGALKSELRALLAEVAEEDGAGPAARGRRRGAPSEGAGQAGDLPPVGVFEVLAPDRAGDIFARPVPWRGEGEAPAILIVPRAGDPALGTGDRVLLRVMPAEGGAQGPVARLIRRLQASPRRVLGIYRTSGEGGRIQPIDKGADLEWLVARGASMGARDGELVEAEAIGSRARIGLPRASVTARLGDPSAPRAVSLIAIHQHAIPDVFSDAALAEAEAAEPCALGRREDLRDLPFVTIDPHDARDRDDAVLAQPDTDPANPGGHVLWVAIADVAHYVRPQSALDREARLRGNSTYFPDRVVPMLPEALSGDLCSLHEGVDRPCIAVRMVIDAEGRKRGHRFVRGLMRNRAALSYHAVQAAADGEAGAVPEPLGAEVIAPLYAAWAALSVARDRRAPLDLDLPERRITFDAEGRVASIAFRERLPAHRLIEDFMVEANVAAAETLGQLHQPLLYRVHEPPEAEKLDALREVAEASGFALPRGQVLTTAQLNRLLAQAEGSESDAILNMSVLRAMQQAFYGPENLGHFGLALREYAHFTSPIRRYADLIVHRALIAAHRWGSDGLSAQDAQMIADTGLRISAAERRSMAAERDTTDRYVAAFMADRVGQEMAGHVSGVQRFGLFVRLDETGADGLLPVRALGHEFFVHDADAQTLTGSDSGIVLGLGQRLRVRLAEAVPVTGALRFDLVAIEGARHAPAEARRRGRPARAPHTRGARIRTRAR